MSGKASDKITWLQNKKKKSPDEAKVDDENENALKSIGTGVGNGTTNLGEVISMCVVSVRLRQCKLGQRSGNICLIRYM